MAALLTNMSYFGPTCLSCTSISSMVQRLRKTLASKPVEQLKQTTLFGFGEPSSAPSSPVPVRRRSTISKGRAGRTRAPPLDLVRDKSSDDSDVGAITFEPELGDLSDHDHEPYVSPPKTRRARLVRRRAESPANATNIIMTPDEPDEEEVVRPSRKGKRKGRLIHDSGSEELPPRKRKLVKGVRPPSPDEANISDDVDKDSEFLCLFSLCHECRGHHRNP